MEYHSIGNRGRGISDKGGNVIAAASGKSGALVYTCRMEKENVYLGITSLYRVS